MRRGVATGIGLWILAAVALAVALGNRRQAFTESGGEGWTSYAPLSEIDRIEGMQTFDPVLWLGMAIGLAVAGAVVLALGLRARGIPGSR